MDKIIFEDLPSTNTPISAKNLNQVQSNVETAFNEVDTSIQNIISKEFKFVSRGESTDFNDFKANGFYQCNFQNGTNAPDEYSTGMLLVFGNYYISQLYIANLNGTTSVFARASGDKGETWASWTKLS